MSEQEDKNPLEGGNDSETLWARSVEHLLKKGRIAVWMILLGTFLLGLKGVLDGKQVLEVIKLIGAFWLGAEAGARVPK
ncbi:MAG: hypothetical protein U9N09_10170 [Euryarchaeota archaeon]|nr:hypothetical protein [Euryarchaeota archaeon]